MNNPPVYKLVMTSVSKHHDGSALIHAFSHNLAGI
jgi:hypothetical protein